MKIRNHFLQNHVFACFLSTVSIERNLNEVHLITNIK